MKPGEFQEAMQLYFNRHPQGMTPDLQRRIREERERNEDPFKYDHGQGAGGEAEATWLPADGVTYHIWVLPVNGKKKRSEPLFQIGSTKQWMIDNGYFQEHEGDPSPNTFKGSKLTRRIEELEKKVESLIANQHSEVDIDLEDI